MKIFRVMYGQDGKARGVLKAICRKEAIPVLPASGCQFECTYRARSDETRESASYFMVRSYPGIDSAESGLVKPIPLSLRTEEAGSRRLCCCEDFENMVGDNDQSGQCSLFKDLR